MTFGESSSIVRDILPSCLLLNGQSRVGNSNAILPMITVAGVPPFHSDEIEAEPLINRPFCPDKAILAGFSGSFAQCPLSVLAGRHDDADFICLRRRAVNN